MRPKTELPVVQIGQGRHSPNLLTNSYFVVDSDLEVTNNTTYPVVIHHPDGESIETNVRTHVLPNKMVKFRFNDLTLQEGDQLKSWANQYYKSTHGDVLNNVSYDQIAKGDTGVATKQVEPKAEKEKKPVVAVIVMVLTLAAIGFVIANTVAKSNYVALANGALIGNYNSIKAGVDGNVSKMMVNAGDSVSKGEVLFLVVNSEVETTRKLAEAEMHSSQQKVVATEKLIQSEEKKLELVGRQLESDIKIANIDYNKSVSLLASQKGFVSRIYPLMEKQYISRLELKNETDILRELEASVASKAATIEILESRAKTIKEGKLYFLGGNVDNSISNYQAKLILQKAEMSKAEASLEAADLTAAGFEVRAAYSGKIYAVYRDLGEYVEAKDGVLAIIRDEQPWAFATVRRNKAIKIKEGDKVNVILPAYDRVIEGSIASIGHRGLYTESGWSQDFRVDNSQDIPIKVSLSPEISDIPTGTRLKMVVPLALEWPWE